MINRVRSNGRNFAEYASFNDLIVKVYGNDGWIEVFFDSDYAYCSFSTSNITRGDEDDFVFSLLGNYRVVNEGMNITFHEI